MQIAVIGAGAAGMMAAVTAAEHHPSAKITVFEKAAKALKKVSISGGGRCNLTNACQPASEFLKAYPRGSQHLKHAFYRFSNLDAMQWFTKNGVPLTIQADGCVFPEKQDALEVVRCLVNLTSSRGIILKTNTKVTALTQQNDQWRVVCDNSADTRLFDKVIVTTGGSPKPEGLLWLAELGHAIVPPVPSLFSMNVNDKAIRELMGLVAENALISIPSAGFKSAGALLFTHWGISGPAVLKLSSLAARYLNEQNYQTVVQVNWQHGLHQELVLSTLTAYSEAHKNKLVSVNVALKLPLRLWQHLLLKAGIAAEKRYAETGSKQLRRLAEVICSDRISIAGKTTFREEYVTAGGVSLKDVNMRSMESKICKNLYFAGEVLDIDAITGGFNLQAAWSTGFLAGLLQ